MESLYLNHELELAAKRTLTRFSVLEDEPLKPLYLQPDRAIFLAEKQHIVLKVYKEGNVLQHEYEIAQKAASIGVPTPQIIAFVAGPPAVLAMQQVIGQLLSSHNQAAAQEAGKYLQRFHTLPAHPPFSGGQQHWDAFISWWAEDELEKVKRLALFAASQIAALQERFVALQPLLAHRPIVLLHGDLQPVHILVGSHPEKVLAFLDFADAQPGDPLLDIAVLTLWDHPLADFLLAGYGSIENNAETKHLLSLYRLLRQLSEIPWLLERGFHELAARDIAALKASFVM